jgi:hypothetical protein
MPGLVPGISLRIGTASLIEMAGSSPAMTSLVSAERRTMLRFARNDKDLFRASFVSCFSTVSSRRSRAIRSVTMITSSWF